MISCRCCRKIGSPKQAPSPPAGLLPGQPGGKAREGKSAMDALKTLPARRSTQRRGDPRCGSSAADSRPRNQRGWYKMAEGQRKTAKGELLLSLRNVSKQFGAVTALSDIELDVH